MRQTIDQLGRELFVETVPNRIVSVVPSQTEFLYQLGLTEEVVGITKFCVHPKEWFGNKTRVGGTKTLDIEKIKALHPQLIIANKEENVLEQVEAVSKFCPVWVSDVNNLADACQMMESVGEITGRADTAVAVVQQIKKRFATLSSTGEIKRCCYLVWKDPLMTVGGDTFINDMLSNAGFENAFRHLSRYPQVSLDQIKRAECRYLFLSSEPYPFREKHLEEFRKQLAGVDVVLVDGEMFSWYGSRLLKAPEYFLSLQKQLQPLA